MIPPLPNQMPSSVVRLYEPSDFDQAVRIIHAIGSNRLGENLPSWVAVFERVDGLIWTVTVNDTPVGFGGRIDYGDGVTCLHTDIIDPKFQRQGFGSLLCLARLASVDLEYCDVVGVYATEHTRTFYERFGFELEADPKPHPEGYLVHRMSMRLTPSFIESVDEVLDKQTSVRFALGDELDPDNGHE
jgi:GNAT superfamily N-acetyltransferase